MSEPFVAEIKIISWTFPPRGWVFCNGQLLPINQNQALFSILGTTYGGDGRVNFALPDLRGRVPIHMGDGFTLGEKGGETTHTLAITELAAHTHNLMTDARTAPANNTDTPGPGTVLGQSGGISNPGHQDQQPYTVQIYNTPQSLTPLAGQSVTSTGGGQPHQNMQPFLTLNFIIALTGIFPSQN